MRGGVDLIQLRDKALDDDGLLAASEAFRGHEALFILNDRPDLVEACGADGVHVGQDDLSPTEARALVGPQRIVGRSTHEPAQAAEAIRRHRRRLLRGRPRARDADQARAPRRGPVTTSQSVRSHKPWFAIGGLDATNVHEVVERGATRIVVVRAITDADDPEAAARRAAGRPCLSTTTPPAGPSRRDPPEHDLERGYARSRAKADAIRAQLEPLGPDERPLGLKLATALAAFVAVANLIGAAAGLGGESPALGVVFAVFMGGVAYGLWQRSYGVILLFQALLALTIIVFTLSLAFASNILAVLLCVVGIAVCAPVFWLLVRVMARLQVPQP